MERRTSSQPIISRWPYKWSVTNLIESVIIQDALNAFKRFNPRKRLARAIRNQVSPDSQLWAAGDQRILVLRQVCNVPKPAEERKCRMHAQWHCFKVNAVSLNNNITHWVTPHGAGTGRASASKEISNISRRIQRPAADTESAGVLCRPRFRIKCHTVNYSR